MDDRRERGRLSRLSVWVVLAVGVLVAATIAGQPTKMIRIIYTNDTLGYIEPCG